MIAVQERQEVPGVREYALVRQQHEFGCVIASMAIILGEPYETVRAYWPPDHDFDKRGTADSWGDQLLAERGYATRWLSQYVFGKKRAVWPLPPFAPIHFCKVRTVSVKESKHTHMVVLLFDGQVLDPYKDEPGLLSDYRAVLEMCGVYKVEEMTAP